MKIRWVISNDLGNQSDIKIFTDAIQNNKDCIYEPVSLEEVLTPSFKPNISYDIPTIFYGPVNFISRMEKLNYNPGVFGTIDSFSYGELCKNIPHDLLFNNPFDTFVGTAKEILEKYSNNNSEMFFKPYKDDKSVIGSVKEIKDIINFCELVIDNKIPDVTLQTKFLVSIPYGIDTEYRLFVINGEIITGSEYKPKISRHVPKNVIEFGKEIINYWNPFPFFVLDVAISNGNCFVMEIQNFHSAGYYDSDIDKIIIKVNEFLKRKIKNETI